MQPTPCCKPSLQEAHSSLRHPSRPSAMHSSTQYYNWCARVCHPTGPSLTDIGPQALHKPSTQPALLSKSKDSGCKEGLGNLRLAPKSLGLKPHSLRSHGLLDPGQESPALTKGLPLPAIKHTGASSLGFKLPCQNWSVALP